MPLTLAAYEQTLERPLDKGVILGLRMESNVADILQWAQVDSLSVDGVRFDEVPTPAYTAINATIQEDTVRGKPINWGIFKMLHHIDIDKALEGDSKSIESQSGRQIRMAIKGAAYVMNDRFINGDRASDPTGPDGINVVSQQLASSQTVNPSSQIDISGTVTAAVANETLDLIDLAIARIEGHLPSFAFANQEFLLRLKSILRQQDRLGNHHDWLEDNPSFVAPRESERPAAMKPHLLYDTGGFMIPFYDAGVKADQTTNIILNNFSDVGSGETRVFFVKQGPDDFEGLMAEALHIEPVGTLEDKDSERWRLKAMHGFATWGPRSLVRMGGLKVA